MTGTTDLEAVVIEPEEADNLLLGREELAEAVPGDVRRSPDGAPSTPAGVLLQGELGRGKRAPLCQCGCGRRTEPQRKTRRFSSYACRKRFSRTGGQPPTDH